MIHSHGNSWFRFVTFSIGCQVLAPPSTILLIGPSSKGCFKVTNTARSCSFQFQLRYRQRQFPIVFIIQYCAYLYIDWADRTVSFVTLLGCLPFMECDHYVIRCVVQLVHLPWFSRVVRHYYLCMVSITQYQRKYLFLLFAIAFQDFFQPWPYKFHKYIKIDLANLVESYFFFDKSHVVSALVRITTNAHLLTFS